MKPFEPRTTRLRHPYFGKGVDTDTLGTFSGEISRLKSPLDAAIEKVRMGLASGQGELAIANEGSFGPHPSISFFSSDLEILVLVDDEFKIVIEEHVISTSITRSEVKVNNVEEANVFLEKIQFGFRGEEWSFDPTTKFVRKLFARAFRTENS